MEVLRLGVHDVILAYYVSHCAVVDADNDTTVEDDWYAPNNGLGSSRHPDDKKDGPLTFTDPLGDVSGSPLGESAELLAMAKERELLTALF
jgi:hypothetical protein